MQRNHYTEYPVGTIVNVFHFGRPDVMKVIDYDHERQLVKLQYTVPEFGIDYKSCATLNKMDLQCQEFQAIGRNITV